MEAAGWASAISIGNREFRVREIGVKDMVEQDAGHRGQFKSVCGVMHMFVCLAFVNDRKWFN